MQWVLLVLLVGCGVHEPVERVAVVAEQPTAWDREVEAVDRDIAASGDRLAANPAQWLVEAQLASLYAERARLTGSYKDYDRAEAAIGRAFDIAPDGSGPFLARASLNFTLHRLDAVEADLVAAENRGHHSNETASAIALLRARVHMERGHYVAAEAGYRRSLALSDSLQAHAALAHHAWQTGDSAAAEKSLAEAESRYHGRRAEPRAWFHLQRAITDLESAHYEEALAHLADADAALPGYWLIEEHIAEIKALQGDFEEALTLYRSVVARTSSPELMGAMAGVLSDLDRDAEAAYWVARADRLFSDRMARYPEAVVGPGLEHALDHGQAADALALAEANVAIRPNGQALDLLARAYMKSNRPTDAQATVRRAVALGWGGEPSIK